jgi:hypothetical protein
MPLFLFPNQAFIPASLPALVRRAKLQDTAALRCAASFPHVTTFHLLTP